jgi:Asp-tRNA(Asn)/Glu-tRNA(Gln) amidotransferase A subunit family amidase
MLKMIAGFDNRDPDSVRLAVPDYPSLLKQDLSGLRVAYSPDYG